MTDQITNELLAEALIVLSLWDYRQFEMREDGEVYFRDMRIPSSLVEEMGTKFACAVKEVAQ